MSCTGQQPDYATRMTASLTTYAQTVIQAEAVQRRLTARNAVGRSTSALALSEMRAPLVQRLAAWKRHQYSFRAFSLKVDFKCLVVTGVFSPACGRSCTPNWRNLSRSFFSCVSTEVSTVNWRASSQKHRPGNGHLNVKKCRASGGCCSVSFPSRCKTFAQHQILLIRRKCVSTTDYNVY